MNNVMSCIGFACKTFNALDKGYRCSAIFPSFGAMVAGYDLMPLSKASAANQASFLGRKCAEMDKKGYGITVDFSDFDQSECASHMGNCLVARSGKVIFINKWLAENDPQAALFLMRRQFRLLEKSSHLVRMTALVVCDVASCIFSPCPLLFQFGAHLTLWPYLINRQTNDATAFAIEKASKEELEGAIRFCSAKAKVFNRPWLEITKDYLFGGGVDASSFSDNAKLLKKVEDGYRYFHNGTDQQIDQIKRSEIVNKIRDHLEGRANPTSPTRQTTLIEKVVYLFHKS